MKDGAPIIGSRGSRLDILLNDQVTAVSCPLVHLAQLRLGQGLVGTIAGTVVYIVALPINLLTFNLVEPARTLILEPVKFTFVRELGAD